MRIARAITLGAAAVFFFAWCVGLRAEPAPPGEVLVTSDLHFDPMVDPRLVDRLAATDPELWGEVLDGSGDKSLGRYGRDTNWMLLRSALRQMKETLPQPGFVLISGDFLAHDFRREFDAAASDHSDASYRVFVRKTMQFIAQQLMRTFSNRPVLPALGNNDEVCGDYELQPKGPFLADTLPLLRALVSGAGGGSDFDTDWRSYGNYSAFVGGVRVLSTNTNFLSIRYRNACGSAGDPDPGRATLAWLASQLAAAKQAHQPVWLVYHIPPGIDGYATLKRGTCPDAMIPMWEQAYAEAFADIVRSYSDTIVASFAGHVHVDDFRLMGDGGGRSAFTLITPAVSPVFGQNPAFRTMVYDAAGGIVDQTTYDLKNLPEATVAGGMPPLWEAEYTFTREWNLPRVDLPSLGRLYSLVRDAPAERERWRTIFPVSSAVYWSQFSGDSRARAVRAFACASGNVLKSDYSQCYCSSN